MRISETELLQALPRLRRYARSLSRSAGEAEELLRDCLEKALARAHTRGGEELSAWLMAIMTGLHRSGARREHRGESPADPIERQRIAAAVDRLSPDNRAVLMLVVVEGYSYAETAAALGVPLATVMSRLSRARAALAETLRRDNVVAFPRPT